jgi:hypothetical protein
MCWRRLLSPVTTFSTWQTIRSPPGRSVKRHNVECSSRDNTSRSNENATWNSPVFIFEQRSFSGLVCFPFSDVRAQTVGLIRRSNLHVKLWFCYRQPYRVIAPPLVSESLTQVAGVSLLSWAGWLVSLAQGPCCRTRMWWRTCDPPSF